MKAHIAALSARIDAGISICTVVCGLRVPLWPNQQWWQKEHSKDRSVEMRVLLVCSPRTGRLVLIADQREIVRDQRCGLSSFGAGAKH